MIDTPKGKTELEVIACNAGLGINVARPPSKAACKTCVDTNAPGAKTLKELQDLHKYMHGKDVPKGKMKDRKWIESKCL